MKMNARPTQTYGFLWLSHRGGFRFIWHSQVLLEAKWLENWLLTLSIVPESLLCPCLFFWLPTMCVQIGSFEFIPPPVWHRLRLPPPIMFQIYLNTWSVYRMPCCFCVVPAVCWISFMWLFQILYLRVLPVLSTAWSVWDTVLRIRESNRFIKVLSTCRYTVSLVIKGLGIY